MAGVCELRDPTEPAPARPPWLRVFNPLGKPFARGVRFDAQGPLENGTFERIYGHFASTDGRM